MGDVVATYPDIGECACQDGVLYSAKIVEIYTEVIVPDNGLNLTLQTPQKFDKAAQITRVFEQKVMDHKYLNFEREHHGISVWNPDVIMPMFIYPLVGEPGSGSSGGNPTIDSRIRYQKSSDPELHKSVIKAKPFLLGWLKCADKIVIEPLAEGVRVSASVRAIR